MNIRPYAVRFVRHKKRVVSEYPVACFVSCSRITTIEKNVIYEYTFLSGELIMDIPELMRTISLILAPAIMISCCLIFLHGQLQRYDSIGARMRLMSQEHFEILRTLKDVASSDMGRFEHAEKLRISEIETQLPHLLGRSKLLHEAALVISLAILQFVVSMFVIALATVLHVNAIAMCALFLFLLGMVTIFIAGVIMMLEIYKSHLSVRYEVLHALNSGEKNPTLTLPHRAARVPLFSE
jgi:hypothetical protein